MDIIKQIQNLQEKHLPRVLPRIIKKDKLLYNTIREQTKFLDERSPTISERIYCLRNDITEIKICKTCGKQVKFVSSYYKKI